MEDLDIEPDLVNSNAVRAIRQYREKLEAEGRAPDVVPLVRTLKQRRQAQQEPEQREDAGPGLPGG